MFPVGIPMSLREEIATCQENEETLVQTLDSSSPKLLIFLKACFEDRKFLQKNEGLTKKLMACLDQSFLELSKEQKDAVLNIIYKNKDVIDPYFPANFIVDLGDEFIAFNRMQLAMRSPVVKAWIKFAGEKDLPFVWKIEQKTPATIQAFELIKYYLIHDDLPLVQDYLIPELMNQANVWQLSELIELLPDRSVLTPDNYWMIYEESRKLGHRKMQRTVINYMYDSLTLDQIDPLFKMSTEANLPELKQLCQRFLIKKLGEHDPEYFEDLDPNPSSQLQLLKNLMPILEGYERDLKFSAEELAEFSAGELVVLFRLYPEKIKKLKLSGSIEEIEFLTRRLPPYLKSLNLSQTALSVTAMEAIVLNCPHLKKLNLEGAVNWNKGERPDQSNFEWKSLEMLTELTALNVAHCKHVLPHFGRLIQNSPSLKILELGPNVEDFIRYAPLISANCRGLKALNLHQVEVTTEALEFFSKSGLTHLSLNHCIFPSSFDFSVLVKLFPKLKSLKIERDCEINSHLFRKLILGLKELEELELNLVNDEEALLKLLQQNSNLHRLALSGKITDKICECLSRHCPALTSLFLSSIEMTDEGITQLLNAPFKLKELSIPFVFLNKEMLINLTQRFPLLETLCLGGLQIKPMKRWNPFELQTKLCERIGKNERQEEFIETRDSENLQTHLSGRIIGKSFARLKKLRHLEIGLNAKTENVLKAVSLGCPELRHLKIHLAAGEKPFISQYLHDLVRLKKLRTLDAQMMGHQPDSLIACLPEQILALSQSLPLLEELCFFCWECSDSLLSQIIEAKPRLRKLCVLCCDAVLEKSLIQKLQGMPNLTDLLIPVTESQMLEFQSRGDIFNEINELIKNNPRIKEFDGCSKFKEISGMSRFSFLKDITTSFLGDLDKPQ